MNKTIAFGLLAWIYPVVSEGQQLEWLKYYAPRADHCYASGFVLTADGRGNIYGTGSIGGSVDFDGNIGVGHGSPDIIVAKWDSMGTNQWVRVFGGTSNAYHEADWDNGEFIRYDPYLDRILVTGRFSNNINFGPAAFSLPDEEDAIFTASFQPDGTCEWARAIRGYDWAYNGDVLLDHNSDQYWFALSALGPPYFVGFPGVTIPHGSFVARYDSDGVLKSTRRLSDLGHVNGAAWVDSTHWLLSIAAIQGADLFGQPLDIPVESAGVLALVDTAGTVIWSRVHAGSSDQGNGSGSCTVVGNHAIVWGGFGGEMMFDSKVLNSGSQWSRGYLASYSLSGEPEWIRTFPSAESAGFSRGIAVDENSTMYVLGYYTDTTQVGPLTALPRGEVSSFIVRFDTLGNCLSAFNFGPSYGTDGSVALSGDDIVFATPYAWTMWLGPASAPATHSVMLAKLDSMSGFNYLLPPPIAPVWQENLFIFPNPNTGSCSMRLPSLLQSTNDLLLSIFDQTGRLIHRSSVNYGDGTLSLDLRTKGHGIYHVELHGGELHYQGTVILE